MSRRLSQNEPSGVDEMYSIKVDNLKQGTPPAELRHLFSKFGEIGDVYIPLSKYDGGYMDYGFVRFIRHEDADRAVTQMDGREMLNGVRLRCERSERARPLYEREMQRTAASGQAALGNRRLAIPGGGEQRGAEEHRGLGGNYTSKYSDRHRGEEQSGGSASRQGGLPNSGTRPSVGLPNHFQHAQVFQPSASTSASTSGQAALGIRRLAIPGGGEQRGAEKHRGVEKGHSDRQGGLPNSGTRPSVGLPNHFQHAQVFQPSASTRASISTRASTRTSIGSRLDFFNSRSKGNS